MEKIAQHIIEPPQMTGRLICFSNYNGVGARKGLIEKVVQIQHGPPLYGEQTPTIPLERLVGKAGVSDDLKARRGAYPTIAI